MLKKTGTSAVATPRPVLVEWIHRCASGSRIDYDRHWFFHSKSCNSLNTVHFLNNKGDTMSFLSAGLAPGCCMPHV